MKNIIKTGFGAILSASLLLGSCTSDFENINLDERKVSDEQLNADGFLAGARIMQMQQCLYFNFGDAGKNWVFQVFQNLNADVWSGYMTSPTPFPGNKDNNNVYVFNTNWNSYMWDYTYNYFMAPALKVDVQLKDQPDVIGVNNVLKVAQMHKVSDFYGPIIYRNYGSSKTGGDYESQESVYKAFFEDLDLAVNNLSGFVKANPGAKPLSKFDLMFEGDYIQWIKYANSLRLRLAVRIAYVNPTLAKQEAEKALANEYGVFEGEEKAAVKTGVYTNPVGEIAQAWHDIKMGASMESYLKGYKDARISKYFSQATTPAGDYHGMRNGIIVDNIEGYRALSCPNVQKTDPVLWMCAAEAYFLRAEGALRQWNMNGDAKDFLSWVIQCNHPEFSPDVVCDWLEARLPNPVDDQAEWKIKTDISELDQLSDKDLDEMVPPNPEK